MQARFSWLAVLVSFLAAAILEVLGLPDILLKFRPEWLVITLIYWQLRYPDKIGISTAILLGLMMDVISGMTFGTHVLAYSVMTYLVLSVHQRLKMFPVIQQSVIVFFLVGIQLMVVYLLSMALQGSQSGLSYTYFYVVRG